MKWKYVIGAMLGIAVFNTFIPIVAVQCEKEDTPFIRPVICDGKYYFSENDLENDANNNDLKRAFEFLRKRLIAGLTLLPKKLIFLLISFFDQPAPQSKEVESDNKVKLSVVVQNPTQTKPQQNSMEPVITWIGHASFLIQIGEFNILTDPIFGDVKARLLGNMGFTVTRREWPPGIKLGDLPPIDAIVISHNHLDHTDGKSLSAICKKYPNVVALVPKGDKKLFKSMGFKQVYEKTWWEQHTLEKNNKTLTTTFLPAKHWSIHIDPRHYRKSLWGSWMISCDQMNIYFAGDTAYEGHFKQIAQKFSSIDVALMPIAPTSPKNHEKNKHQHVDAKEAIDAFIDLNARCFIPMHWGTFFRGPDTYEHPINQLDYHWKTKNESGELNGKKLVLAHCGQQISHKMLSSLPE